MGNPFAGFRAAMEVMVREGKVLPATGQAIEDLMRPDQEEAYDRIRMGVTPNEILEMTIETPNRERYVTCRPIPREEKHIFRYFLDGSARTFYLGNVVEGDRQSPVHVSQIGAAGVFRESDGRMRTISPHRRFLLLLDKDAFSFGEQVKQAVAAAGDQYQFLDVKEPDEQSDSVEAGKEPRSRAAHKANHQMRRLEEEIARNLDRKSGEWLVLDGGLGSEYAKQWLEGLQYIGVVKSSYKQLNFSVRQGRAPQTINTFQLLADLKQGQRTQAFGLRDGCVATWYVRVRGPEYLEFPLMGVLRVELPNPGQEAVPSELIDELSGALIAERCVTPHGKDIRWHSHLYPIYLAEQAVKNRFVSTEVLKAGMKWPIPPGVLAGRAVRGG